MARLTHAFKVNQAICGMTYDQLGKATGLARQTLLNFTAGRT